VQTAGVQTARALWILSRPRLAPYVVTLTLVGFVWAHWDRALRLRGGSEWLLVAAAWLALHAGTLWLNAALDRDEGEVLYGRAIPPPPGVAGYGYAALALSVLLAVLAGPIAGACAALCVVLSVLYSHPATRWKGHPLGGPLVNGLGYGLLSSLAGWSAAGVSANPRTVVIWLLSSLGVMGCYFAAQAFQGQEDAERGYRTFVVTHGPAATLRLARLCLAAGFVGGMILSIVGWFPRVCLAGMPMWLWVDDWLRRWAAQPGGGSAAHAQTMARRLLVSVLVCLTLVCGEYVRESFAREPVAGLGTLAGHPVDRPRLPPRELIAWEKASGKELLD
jgi:4-hydroxybenzoate polyprenyltransferase